MLRLTLICALVVSLTPAFAQAQHEHEDLIVGRTSGGQLMIEFDDFGEVHDLSPVSGALNGWLGDDPGFDHLEEDEPGEDFYMLEAGANILFEVVAFDTAFQIWGPGFSGPFSTPGESVFLGDEELHDHVEFHINSDDPGFDELDSPWSASFKLVDTGSTGYSDSPVYTLTFAPEPGSLVLLGLGGLALLRRRR